jgi:hypothetical protein
MMNYYAHVTKLFEDKPGAFGWLRQNLNVLPENAAALFHFIACLWPEGGRPLVTIRQQVAFHRNERHQSRREAQDGALKDLSPAVVPALARLSTALCIELGAHWDVDLVIHPLPWYPMPGMYDVRFFKELDGSLFEDLFKNGHVSNPDTPGSQELFEGSSSGSHLLRRLFGSW